MFIDNHPSSNRWPPQPPNRRWLPSRVCVRILSSASPSSPIAINRPSKLHAAAQPNLNKTYIFIQSMPVITKVVQATFSYPTALRVFKDLPQKLAISNFIRQSSSFPQSATNKGSR
jgi:hypothetical protein